MIITSSTRLHQINEYFSEQIKYKTNILAKPKNELKQEYCASKSRTHSKINYINFGFKIIFSDIEVFYSTHVLLLILIAD